MYGTITPYGTGFPSGFHLTLVYHSAVLQPRSCRNMNGLGSFPFARHYSGNHYYFLFLRLLRCFSSARSRIIRHTFSMPGYPIRKSADQFAYANPRSLSQLITSFIASESQGIPRVPLLTFFSPRPFCYRGDAFGSFPQPRRIPSAQPKPVRQTHPTGYMKTSLLLSSLFSCFLPICQRTSSLLLDPRAIPN